MLGADPETGLPVLVLTGRFGPFVQLGELEDGSKEKPKRASLFGGMDPTRSRSRTRSALLSLPRVVGADAEGTEITAQNGRYGPYLKKGTDSRSLGSEEQLFTVTLDEAEAIFAQPKQRRGRAAKPPIAELGAHPDTGAPVRVLDGRFGPYVTDGTTNATVPRGTDPAAVTLEQGVELLRERAARARPRTTAKRTTKKTAKKNDQDGEEDRREEDRREEGRQEDSREDGDGEHRGEERILSGHAAEDPLPEEQPQERQPGVSMPEEQVAGPNAPFIPPHADAPPIPPAPWRVFGTQSFFRLWLAQVVSSLGDWIGLIAILAIAARVSDNSGAAVSLVMVARVVPGFFLGTVGGVIIDRFDRRKVMVVCDIGRAASS